nr:hypothetical protein [uncultured Mediterranean phage uvMED]
MVQQNPPNFGTYVPSQFYSNFQTPEGALTYQQFNPQLYADANPDVATNPGFIGQGPYRPDSQFPNPTAQEALYASYLNRFPDNPDQFLPDQTGFRAGEYARTPEELASITAADNLANLQTGLDEFIDSETGEIKPEFAGGQLGTAEELKNLDADALQTVLAGLNERKNARATGFKGEFTDLAGGDAYDKFKASVGTKEGYTDEFGQETALGKTARLAKNPELPAGTELDLTEITAKPDEFLDTSAYNLDEITPLTAAQGTVTDASVAPKTDAQSFTATQALDSVKAETITAAKQKKVTDKINAQQGIVSSDATVQGQLTKLMEQFEDGKIPPFAAGAIRSAQQMLAARGMSASGMAGASIVQAAMEAATPIAAADAQTYRSMQELNLNNRQQAEVLNAQMTLQLDLQNLSNEQQARVANTQNRVQSIFNDQAAVNASKQFNAASEQQNDQFFSTMFNETSKFKAAQSNAMSQYNAGQVNATNQFNETLSNNREQFETKNQVIIDQANVVYRRNINTANTAIQNAENEFNVRAKYAISQTAQANLLQEQRDQVNYARVTSLNDIQFQNQIALASYAFDKDLDLAEGIAKGNLTGRILGTLADKTFGVIANRLKIN